MKLRKITSAVLPLDPACFDARVFSLCEEMLGRHLGKVPTKAQVKKLHYASTIKSKTVVFYKGELFAVVTYSTDEYNNPILIFDPSKEFSDELPE